MKSFNFLHKSWKVLNCRPPFSNFFFFCAINQIMNWQWNILNLTTLRKTFWRIVFYFRWPNCTLPIAAPCVVSQSLLKQLHFCIQIIHHCLDLFLPFFTFHTFGVLCGDLRWGGRGEKKCFFVFSFFFSPHKLLLKHLRSLVYARNSSDRQGCPIYSQIKKNHTGRRC